jgi:hypothetical protein
VVFRVGYDLGGVVIGNLQPGGTGAEVPDAIDVICENVDTFGRQNNFIISKVKDSTDTEIWLAKNDFISRTNFDPQNIFFCRYREDKARIADTLEGGPLDCFLDDRADVLRYMTGTRLRCLLEIQPKVWLVPTAGMRRVPNWNAFRELCKHR